MLALEFPFDLRNVLVDLFYARRDIPVIVKAIDWKCFPIRYPDGFWIHYIKVFLQSFWNEKRKYVINQFQTSVNL